MRVSEADGHPERSTESLLDVLLAIHARGNQHAVSRLVYVSPGRDHGAEGAHAKLVQRRIMAEGEGMLTGLLLCLPSCVVHMIEAQSSSMLYTILEELDKHGTESGADTRVRAARAVGAGHVCGSSSGCMH